MLNNQLGISILDKHGGIVVFKQELLFGSAHSRRILAGGAVGADRGPRNRVLAGLAGNASRVSAVWRSTHEAGFNRAGAAAPITIDDVAVVAGLIRLQPVAACRRAVLARGCVARLCTTDWSVHSRQRVCLCCDCE